MDTAKIQELIAELQSEIEVRRQAVRSLEKLLPTAVSAPIEIDLADNMLFTSDSIRPIPFTSTDSYVDLAVKIIAANDFRPLPMKDIVDRIRMLKNNANIERRSVEATLYRHMKLKGDKSRVIKTSPGIYGARRPSRDELIA